MFVELYRDCIGDGSVVGDTRWAGSFGVQADFIARTHCSMGIIKLEDIQVSKETTFAFLGAIKFELSQCCPVMQNCVLCLFAVTVFICIIHFEHYFLIYSSCKI